MNLVPISVVLGTKNGADMLVHLTGSQAPQARPHPRIAGKADFAIFQAGSSIASPAGSQNCKPWNPGEVASRRAVFARSAADPFALAVIRQKSDAGPEQGLPDGLNTLAPL
jgi:hypothetical protein